MTNPFIQDGTHEARLERARRAIDDSLEEAIDAYFADPEPPQLVKDIGHAIGKAADNWPQTDDWNKEADAALGVVIRHIHDYMVETGWDWKGAVKQTASVFRFSESEVEKHLSGGES